MQKRQLITTGICTFIGLILTYYLVFINKSFLRLDESINLFFNNYRPDSINSLFNSIYLIASPTGLIIGTIALVIFFLLNKEYYKTMFILLCVGIGEILETLIKNITERPRPENAIVNINEYSFPSGHATLSIIFFLLIYFLFKDHFSKKNHQIIFLVINVSLIILIGFGRIIINVHWSSDVLAGYLLGLFWFTLVSLLLKIHFKKRTSFNH